MGFYKSIWSPCLDKEQSHMMLWLKTVFFHIGMSLAGLFSVPVPTGDS